ncbi:unnamed protein product, partial [Meganyctiphanes norvegica]
MHYDPINLIPISGGASGGEEEQQKGLDWNIASIKSIRALSRVLSPEGGALFNENNKFTDGPFPDSGVVPGEKQELKDWHNYERQREDALKTGPGEQGAPHELKEGLEKERHDLWNTNGFNALLSDQISIDRSLRDIRHIGCKSKKYKSKLPTVSVVVPFFEEHWTTLLRTVKSVVNRSPSNVLKEIILVDDGSTIKDFLKEPLDKWLATNAPMTQVVRLKERSGLIQARQEGAMVATGDVIVVLDSHVEVMNDWLPPLLAPA